MPTDRKRQRSRKKAASSKTTAAPSTVEREVTSYRDGEPVPYFELKPEGVYYVGTRWDNHLKAHVHRDPVWVCSPLKIGALTRDENQVEWGYFLEITDPDGNVHKLAVPASMFSGNGEQLRGILLSFGLRIGSSPDARRALNDYIQTEAPEKRARCVGRTGWHKDVFAFPHRTIGETDEIVTYQTDTPEGNPYGEAGSIEAWREQVSRRCAGQSRLVFAIAAAFAAPLLPFASAEGGGFHFRGPSSGGKTTALRAAASVYGRPESGDYLHRWRSTDNGLEALATMHSDTLLVLDELGQVDPRAAGESAYMLANGAGKSRADRNGNARARKSWRVLFLSAGEIGLAEHMASAGKKTHAGQEIRMMDIPADAGQGLGIFDHIKKATHHDDE